MPHNALAHHIDSWCATHNKTQRELAVLLKATPASVSRWKTGVAVPSMRSLYKLARAIGVSADELLKDFQVAAKQEAG